MNQEELERLNKKYASKNYVWVYWNEFNKGTIIADEVVEAKEHEAIILQHPNELIHLKHFDLLKEVLINPEINLWLTWQDAENKGKINGHTFLRNYDENAIYTLVDTPTTLPDKKVGDPGSPLNIQVGGGHYKNLKIQPIEYTLQNNLGFCEGNVIKYVTRYQFKNGIEDLKKAKHYIDLLINDLENNQKAQT